MDDYPQTHDTRPPRVEPAQSASGVTGADAPNAPRALTQDEIDHFIEFGFVKLEAAVAPDVITAWMDTAAKRVRRDPDRWIREPLTEGLREKLTRFDFSDPPDVEVTRLTFRGSIAWKIGDFSARTLAASRRLIAPNELASEVWRDGFIVGFPMRNSWARIRAQLWRRRPSPNGWHLDDPNVAATSTNTDVALVPLILLTDVEARRGATVLATDSVRLVSTKLREATRPVDLDDISFRRQITKQCRRFVDVTGQAGDVYLTHPFAMHAATAQLQRGLRVLTNPAMRLANPLDLTKPAESPLEAACGPPDRR